MGVLLDFHRGTGVDARGRRMDAILQWDDARLEAVHDYIQWLFPLPEPSGFNPDAPLLTAADIAVFRAEPATRARMGDALTRMRRFYGWEEGREPGPDSHWITPGDHNFLRISRILRATALCGHAEAARRFLAELEVLAQGPAGGVIGARSLQFWHAAAASY